MNEEQVTKFLLDYTRGIDLINCVSFAIDNDWTKPDDYDGYGCNIDFLDKEKSSVKTKDELATWNVDHHNAFAKAKITKEDAVGFNFPPPYNFISEEALSIDSISDDSAKVEIETDSMTYEFTIEPSADTDTGLCIASIVGKLPWGGDPIKIL